MVLMKMINRSSCTCRSPRRTGRYALEKDIKKYRGKYLKGWDAIRAERHARQLKMGLVDQRWPISARPERAPAWETLDKAKQKEMDEAWRFMPR